MVKNNLDSAGGSRGGSVQDQGQRMSAKDMEHLAAPVNNGGSSSSSSDANRKKGLEDPTKLRHGINLRKTPLEGEDFHFVHIPKCGGTSMTTVLRQVSSNLSYIIVIF